LVSENLKKLRELTEELAHEVDDNHGKQLEFLKIVFDNIQSQVMILSKDDKIIFTNDACDDYNKKTYGKPLSVGKIWYEEMGIFKPDCCPAWKAIEKRDVVTDRFENPTTGEVFIVTAIPLINNGESGTICIYTQEN